MEEERAHALEVAEETPQAIEAQAEAPCRRALVAKATKAIWRASAKATRAASSRSEL